ncbi:MAG: hypothetical protein ACJA1E_001973 [Paracoccaceae bacterium]|jgi:hypothetical protein
MGSLKGADFGDTCDPELVSGAHVKRRVQAFIVCDGKATIL